MMVVDFQPERRELPEDVTYTPEVPQRVLDRHGARILDPATAVVAPGDVPPRSTVYRWGVLLVPDQVTRPGFFQNAIQGALAEIGLTLELRDDQTHSEPRGETSPSDSNPPRPIALRAIEGFDKLVTVDAWHAVQHLQHATRREVNRLAPEIVHNISVECLLSSEPLATLGGAPNEGSGLPGLGYYGREPSIGRLPVALVTEPPPRSKVPSGSVTRRPVIAVLDTGIRQHPWLGTTTAITPPPTNGFIKVWPELQAEIHAAVQVAGTTAAPQFDTYLDTMCTEPLIGTIDRAGGHGLFIAGLIRQGAPDADVLAIRVMGSDGIAPGAGVLRALHRISERVHHAQAQGKPELMIDMVSMSMCFFAESDANVGYKSQLTPIIEQLADQGVLVVAAAGNHSTTRKAYPAAYATELAPLPDRVPVTSVGALNPNGTKAIFSNDGDWVTCFATGAGLVSAYPTDFRGSLTSVLEVPGLNRSAYDFDDFAIYGFAIGTGTSFATPLAAAALANGLISVAQDEPALTLTNVDQGVTVKRALTALETLRRPPEYATEK